MCTHGQQEALAFHPKLRHRQLPILAPPALASASTARSRQDDVVFDNLRQQNELLLLAEVVEEVFRLLKTERLIRLMTADGKNESKSAPP